MKNNTPKVIEECEESWEDALIDINSLSAFEKAVVDQSLREIEAGLGIPHAEVMKQAAEWLKKK